MERDQVSLDLSSLCLPLSQARGSLWLCIHIKGDPVEVLQQPNHEERHLVVSELRNRIGGAGSEIEANEELNESHTCWPRQILGPAPKGRKIKGFGTRYFFTRSSMNRSGSNSSAEDSPLLFVGVYNCKYLPSGPHRSFLRCMIMGVNETLVFGLVIVSRSMIESPLHCSLRNVDRLSVHSALR